jgi:protein-S-isoprenylcysteine O-methyltransferase Ste14
METWLAGRFGNEYLEYKSLAPFLIPRMDEFFT